MKKLAIALLLGTLMVGCSSNTRHDGVIVTDLETGKVYKLEHNLGDTYFISVETTTIVGNDTTTTFVYQ